MNDSAGEAAHLHTPHSSRKLPMGHLVESSLNVKRDYINIGSGQEGSLCSVSKRRQVMFGTTGPPVGVLGRRELRVYLWKDPMIYNGFEDFDHGVEQ